MNPMRNITIFRNLLWNGFYIEVFATVLNEIFQDTNLNSELFKCVKPDFRGKLIEMSDKTK